MIGLLNFDEIGNRKKKRQEKKQERKEKRADKKEARQEKRQDKKTARQDKRQDKKTARKDKKEARGGSRAKKLFLAPARAAFFLLMKINFLQLRTKLREGWKKDKNAITKGVINKFGFKRENFLKELNRKESESLSISLGADPATATAAAQATPIIVQVISVLKAVGVAAGALSAVKASLGPKELAIADEFTAGIEDNIADIPENERSGGGGQSADDFKQNPDLEDSTGGSKLPLLLGIGAAVAVGIYFLTKKK
jgi:hypothetical protein